MIEFSMSHNQQTIIQTNVYDKLIDVNILNERRCKQSSLVTCLMTS